MKGSLMKQYQMIYSYMMKNDVQVLPLSSLNSLTSTTSQIRTSWCMRRDWVLPCLLYPCRFALCISLIEPRFQPLPEDRRCDADKEDRCGVAVQEEGPHDPAAAMLLVMCLLEHENKQCAMV